MPIIRPEVQKILRTAGLTRESSKELEPDDSMSGQLTSAGLLDSSIAEELKNLALHSPNESLRLRALETALKVKGALKDQPISLPTFNIIIQNSDIDLTGTSGVNPIVFPRQSLNKLSTLNLDSAEVIESEEIEIEPGSLLD